MAGLAGGLEAVAEVGERQDKAENELVQIGLKEVVAKNKAIRKKALEDYQTEREAQIKIDNLHGNMYGVDQETQQERLLTRDEIGALLQTMGEEDLKKYASEKNSALVIKSGTKGVDVPAAISGAEDTVEDVKASIPEGGGIAKGQAERVSRQLDRQLAGMNIGKGEPRVTTRTYEGLQYRIASDTTDPKRAKDYLFKGKINGQEVDNIRGYVGDDGMFYINDPRVIKDKPIRATGDKYTVLEEVGGKNDDPNLEAALSYFDKRLKDSGYEKLRTEIIQKSISAQNLGSNLSDMWEIAQDNEVFSKTVLFVGNLSKRIDTEFGGFKFVFNATDDSEDSRAKNARAVSQLDDFIANNASSKDMATRKAVLDAMIFKTAMAQATDGQSNPSDKDLAGALKQLESSNSVEFFQKSQKLWNDTTRDLQNSYNTYTRNNPADVDVSQLPSAYATAKQIYMDARAIDEADIKLATPAFLETTDVEQLKEDIESSKEKPAKAVDITKSVDLGDGPVSMDISIEGTGPDAKVTFKGPSGTVTTTFKEALEAGILTAEDIN